MFASEIKALRPLLGSAGINPAVRDQGIYDYLSLGVIPQPDTIFTGIEALAPGSHVTFDANGIRSQRWWRPSSTPTTSPSVRRASASAS